MTAQKTTLRRRLRDAFLESISVLPLSWKLWLHQNHPRYLLGVLFRLENEPVTVSPAGPAGARFIMKLSWQGHMAYALGTYEPETVQLLAKFVKEGDYCIDAGAHIGYVTILMAHRVGPSGLVTAFEPVPQNFKALQENVNMNALGNVDLFDGALSDHDGTLPLMISANQYLSWTPSATGYAVDRDNVTIEARAVSLDTFLSRTGRKPSLVKIDVEGAELSVLEGAMQTLRSVRPILFVEIHGHDTPAGRQSVELLRSLDYDVSVVGKRGHEAFWLALPVSCDHINPLRGAARA